MFLYYSKPNSTIYLAQSKQIYFFLPSSRRATAKTLNLIQNNPLPVGGSGGVVRARYTPPHMLIKTTLPRISARERDHNAGALHAKTTRPSHTKTHTHCPFSPPALWLISSTLAFWFSLSLRAAREYNLTLYLVSTPREKAWEGEAKSCDGRRKGQRFFATPSLVDTRVPVRRHVTPRVCVVCICVLYAFWEPANASRIYNARGWCVRLPLK